MIFSFALPVVSRHQRLLRLRLDPVKKRAIGFSFQLAINRHQLDTSRARLLPPGQGQRPSGRCADLNHARRAQFLRHPCACPRFYVFGSTKNSLFIFFVDASSRRGTVTRTKIDVHRLRPYHVESTGTCLISEVKQRRAWIVLR